MGRQVAARTSASSSRTRQRNGGKSLRRSSSTARTTTLVGVGLGPGADREPAPGTQEQFGALVAAWVETGAECPRGGMAMSIDCACQRHGARGRRRSGDAAALGAARRARPDRHEVRLRRGAVRRRAPSTSTAQAVRVVRDAGAPRRGARDRRSRGCRPTASHPLQRAWLELRVPQCGFCQAGQLMTAAALLAKKPRRPTSDIDGRMAGQPVPVRDVPADPRGDPQGRGRRHRERAVRRITALVPRGRELALGGLALGVFPVRLRPRMSPGKPGPSPPPVAGRAKPRPRA